MLGSFSESDLKPNKKPPQTFPTRILVAGSEEPRKGFYDFIHALKIIEQENPTFSSLSVTLTGKKN